LASWRSADARIGSDLPLVIVRQITPRKQIGRLAAVYRGEAWLKDKRLDTFRTACGMTKIKPGGNALV
jgi:hypothetical protein